MNATQVKLMTEVSGSGMSRYFPHRDLPAAQRVVKAFVAEVNRRAEAKMLLTHKLEGSHCAAMREVMEELEQT